MSSNQSDIALRVAAIRLSVTNLLALTLCNVLHEETGSVYEPHDVQSDGFELSCDGVAYDGGSFYLDKGQLIIASVTPQIILGDTDDLETLKTKLIEFINTDK